MVLYKNKNTKILYIMHVERRWDSWSNGIEGTIRYILKSIDSKCEESFLPKEVHVVLDKYDKLYNYKITSRLTKVITLNF